MKLQHRDNLFSSLISSPCLIVSPCLILVFFSAVHISVLPHVPSCLPVCSVFFNCTQTVGLKELSHCLGLVPRLLSCANRTHLGSHLGLQVQVPWFDHGAAIAQPGNISGGHLQHVVFGELTPSLLWFCQTLLKLLLSWGSSYLRSIKYLQVVCGWSALLVTASGGQTPPQTARAALGFWISRLQMPPQQSMDHW